MFKSDKIQRVFIALVVAVGALISSNALVVPTFADSGNGSSAAVRAIGENASTDPDYPAIPKDSVTLTTISDGTHTGNPSQECFLNASNGYGDGDNFATDGRVCSGDSVTYSLQMNIMAGRARTITLHFDTSAEKNLNVNADALRQAVCVINAPGISASWDPDSLSCMYQVDRGVSATPKMTIALRATDSHGKDSTGNVLRATVSSSLSSDPSKAISTATSDPVTIISRTLADLTIDDGSFGSGQTPKETYTQKDKGKGYFYISPYSMSYKNWNSSYGIAKPGPWKTDVDVTSFMDLSAYSKCTSSDKTTFTFNGQPISPVQKTVNNQTRWVLENLSSAESSSSEGAGTSGSTGNGTVRLDYKLPSCVLPTATSQQTRTFTAELLPHDDSFAPAEGSRNIISPDPGSNKPADYDTSTVTDSKGHLIDARRGFGYANNNYGKASISYDNSPQNPDTPEPSGDETNLTIYAPRDRKKTVFDSPATASTGSNIHWPTNDPDDYSTQGKALAVQTDGYDHVTSNNQMRAELSFITDDGYVGSMPSTSHLQAGLTLDYSTDSDSCHFTFDTSRNVVVRFVPKNASASAGQIIDPSKYTVQWRTYAKLANGKVAPDPNDWHLNLGDTDTNGGTWIFGRKAPNTDVNQVRISFKDGAFPLGDEGGTVLIDAPLTAGTYTQADNDKLLRTAGTIIISSSSKKLSDGSKPCANGCHLDERIAATPIAVPQKSTMTTTIVPTAMPELITSAQGGTPVSTGRYKTTWKVTSSIVTAYASTPLTPVTMKLTLNKWFDGSTFALSSESAREWTVSSVERATDGSGKSVVTLSATGEGLSLRSTGAYNSSLGSDLTFTVNTKRGIDQSKQQIAETITAPDPSEGSKTLTASSSGSVDFNLGGVPSAKIVATNDGKEEPGSDLTWVASMQSGLIPKDGYWYDRIFLPRAGSTPAPDDKENTWLSYVAQNQGWVPQCEPTTGEEKSGIYDQVCRSAYSSDYTLKKVVINDWNPDSGISVWYATSDSAARVSLPNEQKQCTNPQSTENTFGCDVTYKKATVGSDGTVTFPGLSGSSVPLALYVRSTNNEGVGSNQTVTMSISITPRGGKTNDDYVMWIGGVRTSVIKDKWSKTSKQGSDLYSKDEVPTPWPAANSIVQSSITGTIWRDDDQNGVIGRLEHARYSGVSLTLQKCDLSGNCTDTDRITQTDADGNYSFTNLTHGNYQVRLTNVVRDAHGVVTHGDGSLLATSRDRFSVERQTTQTYSYDGNLKENSRTTAPVTVHVGQNVEHVNFGFYRPTPDASLDKHQAHSSVDADGKNGTVQWDVTIRDDGNMPLTKEEFVDRLSSSAYDVNVRLDHSTKRTLDPSAQGWTTAGNSAALFTDTDGYLYMYKCTSSSSCVFKALGQDDSTIPYKFFAGMNPRPKFSATYVNGKGTVTNAGGAYFVDARGVLYRFDPRNTSAPVRRVTFGSTDADATFKPGLVATDPSNGGNGIVLIADGQGRLHSLSTTSTSASELSVFGGDQETHGYSWASHPHFADSTILPLWGTVLVRVALTDSDGKLSVLDVEATGKMTANFVNLGGFTWPSDVTFPAGMSTQIDDKTMQDQGISICTGGYCFPAQGVGGAVLTDTTGKVYFLSDYKGGASNLWLLNPAVYTSQADNTFNSTTSTVSMPVMHKIVPFPFDDHRDGATNMTCGHIFYTDENGHLWALTRHGAPGYGPTYAGLDQSQITVQSASHESEPTFKPGMVWTGTTVKDSGDIATAVTDSTGRLWNVSINDSGSSSSLQHYFVSVFDSAQSTTGRTASTLTSDPATVTLMPNQPLTTDGTTPAYAGLASDTQGNVYQIKMIDEQKVVSGSYFCWTDGAPGCNPWPFTRKLNRLIGYALIPTSSPLSLTRTGTKPKITTLTPGTFIPLSSGTLFSDGEGTVWSAQGPSPLSSKITRSEIHGPTSYIGKESPFFPDRNMTYYDAQFATTVKTLDPVTLAPVPGLNGEFAPNTMVASSHIPVSNSSAATGSSSMLIGSSTQWIFSGDSGSQSDGSIVTNAGATRYQPVAETQSNDLIPTSYRSTHNHDEVGREQNWVDRHYTSLPSLEPGESLVLHVKRTRSTRCVSSNPWRANHR